MMHFLFNLVRINGFYIVENIKIRRLGWAGHIIRMEEDNIRVVWAAPPEDEHVMVETSSGP
jgi:hypothetical protein